MPSKFQVTFSFTANFYSFSDDRTAFQSQFNRPITAIFSNLFRYRFMIQLLLIVWAMNEVSCIMFIELSFKLNNHYT